MQIVVPGCLLCQENIWDCNTLKLVLHCQGLNTLTVFKNYTHTGISMVRDAAPLIKALIKEFINTGDCALLKANGNDETTTACKLLAHEIRTRHKRNAQVILPGPLDNDQLNRAIDLASELRVVGLTPLLLITDDADDSSDDAGITTVATPK